MAVANNISLVLGGARSGKSLYAETLVDASGLDKVYIATGQAGDDEMRRRIELHQTRRDENWVTVETKVLLVDALISEAREGRALLVDCLTFWVSNLIFEGQDVMAEVDALCETLVTLPGPIVFVSTEVGLGIVPDNELGRAFRDYQGLVNQKVAAVADHVVFVAAGLPVVLKPQS